MPSSEQRDVWDRQWAGKGPEHAFAWYTTDVPPQLEEIVATAPLPEGGALDVGCGPGLVTAYLAGRFSPAVGLDVAETAVREARLAGSSARFLVAEAPPLPFRDDRFALVFDRGCMHNIRRERWTAYLADVGRTLRPGGVFELFFAGAWTKPKRPWWTWRGARRRVALLLGRGNPWRFTAETLRRYVPASMEIVRVEEAPFRSPRGRVVRFTHAVCRRTV